MNKILIIDDDVDMCRMLERFFTRHDFEVHYSTSGKKGLEELEKNIPNVVLCDFRLSDTNGKELLIKIKQANPGLPVIIITGYSEIKIAVEVMKHGAYDYVTKPLIPEELLLSIQNAISSSLETTLEPGQSNCTGEHTLPSPKKHGRKKRYIFGNSPQIKNILSQIDLVAPTDLSVIISGESGSGKEAIAQEIHSRSKRSSAPFVAIDCGILSNDLASSELFGHEKGAFTGADSQKIGCMEMANGGTVFLDEIGNLSSDIQAFLLRVVQERKLRRVGGVQDIDLDIRIIVASNDRLSDTAKKGSFREDLYYRFNEFSINVPPLRERPGDTLIFAHFFLEISNEELEKNVQGFLPEVIEIFETYSWPGNLRELKNIVKRATLLSTGDFIDIKTLPFELVNHKRLDFKESRIIDSTPTSDIRSYTINATESYTDPLPMRSQTEAPEFKQTLKTVSLDAEYEMILDALRKSNFNKSKAAKLLKVDRKTLYNKMKLHDNYKQHFDPNQPGRG